MAFSAKQVAVVGLGKSGKGAIELLLKRQVKVTAFDENPQSPDAAALREKGVEVKLGALAPDFWKGFDLVVVSPGVPLAKPELLAAAAAGAPLVGEVELAWRCLPEGAGPVLGVTGTNGKSTTTALLGELVKQTGKKTFVGGNLGLAFTHACAERYDAHVVELSSFQLEGATTLACLGAAILNLTPDHLDRYESHQAYGEAKARIFAAQPKNGFAVVNADDRDVVRLAKRSHVPVYGFTCDPAKTNEGFAGVATGAAGAFVLLGGGFKGERYAVKNAALRGDHNLQNAMAATLMARLFGATREQVQAGLDAFPGLAHRLERVRELDGVEWINDSKATNVDSSLVALKALKGGIWLIAGGKGKGAPYQPLVDAARGKLNGVLTIGKDAPNIEAAFQASSKIYPCGTLDAAIAKARALAKAGDTVLLSPACASYDQFDNFEHRGDTFKRLVRSL